MQTKPANHGGAAWWRVTIEFTCALTTLVILLGPYLANILQGHNALWFLWQPHDRFILLGCLCTLAAVAVAVRESVRRWCVPLVLRLNDHAFVVALGAGVLANVCFHASRPQGYRFAQYGAETQTAWLAMFCLVGYSLASGRSGLVVRARQLTQIVSPVVLIVVWQLLRLPTLAEPMDPLTAAAKPPGTRTQPVSLQDSARLAPRSVYLLIFDEWSYTRTYRNGQVRPEFRNLAALSRGATTFHEAHSPGTETVASIPRICRQTSDLPDVRRSQAGFVSNNRWTPCRQYSSIFTASGCSDYRRIMVHWGFALDLWLQDELDVSRAYSRDPRADGFVSQSLLHLYNAASYWTDPWSELAYRKLRARIRDAHLLSLYGGIHDDLLAILRDQPPRTFAIVHYPLPHSPFILNSDGSHREGYEDNWDNHSLDGYRRNLACVDSVIGEVVSTLKSAGRFDDSLLILTSDHSWRNDPRLSDRTDEILTHVPLIVKTPGQQQSSEVDADFRTCHLGDLIKRGLREAKASPSLAKRLNHPISTVSR